MNWIEVSIIGVSAFVLGIVVGIIGSPRVEARWQREMALKRLRENWAAQNPPKR